MRRLGQLGLDYLAQRCRLRASPLLARHPNRYSPDPGSEGRVAPVCLPSCERSRERLLDDVVREFVTARGSR